MLINVNQTAINVRKPSAIDALAGRRAFCGEFKYSRDTEIFGEVDSAEYVYQVGKGAVRSYKLLGDGRRQINAFHLPGDIFGVENGIFTGSRPKLSSKRQFASQDVVACLREFPTICLRSAKCSR